MKIKRLLQAGLMLLFAIGLSSCASTPSYYDISVHGIMATSPYGISTRYYCFSDYFGYTYCGYYTSHEMRYIRNMMVYTRYYRQRWIPPRVVYVQTPSGQRVAPPAPQYKESPSETRQAVPRRQSEAVPQQPTVRQAIPRGEVTRPAVQPRQPAVQQRSQVREHQPPTVRQPSRQVRPPTVRQPAQQHQARPPTVRQPTQQVRPPTVRQPTQQQSRPPVVRQPTTNRPGTGRGD